jgi:uncharacterized protein YqgV (UPF0045/DUF77 family)
MIAEIQVLPAPPGTAAERYAHVHAAIEVVEASGLRYEVGPLGTSIEGPPDEVWALLRRVHEATIGAGAGSVVSVVKVAERAGEADAGLTMGGLVDRYREPPR